MKVKQFITLIIIATIMFIIGYSISLIEYSNRIYNLNSEIGELTILCEEPENLLENCLECADKYFLVVESETFDFYVPYGSSDIILGTIPENTKDCRMKICIAYGFNFKERIK